MCVYSRRFLPGVLEMFAEIGGFTIAFVLASCLQTEELVGERKVLGLFCERGRERKIGLRVWSPNGSLSALHTAETRGYIEL